MKVVPYRAVFHSLKIFFPFFSHSDALLVFQTFAFFLPGRPLFQGDFFIFGDIQEGWICTDCRFFLKINMSIFSVKVFAEICG